MVTAGGWWERLCDLPLEMEVTLPDGTRFLGVHASPGNDDGPGVAPQMTSQAMEDLFAGCDADLVCIGHTHLPSSQYWNDIHIVNPGAVSLSLTPDRKANYALLEATEKSYSIEHRQVDYDRSAVIVQLKELGHPGRAFLIRLLS
jgi:predicted phosphodiesterase